MAAARDCRYYVQHGWCRFGESCRFVHPDWVQAREAPGAGGAGSSGGGGGGGGTPRFRPPPAGQAAGASSSAGTWRDGAGTAGGPTPRQGRPMGANLLVGYATGRMTLGGSQFNMASLIQDAWSRLQDDAGFVLQQLGGEDSHCLQAIEEICRATFTTTAGNSRALESFQRVTVPLLHLVTCRRWLNNPMSELSNPVLARIADCLDLQVVAGCLRQLAAAGSIDDPRHTLGERDRARWAPADYAELALPVADFLHVTLLKFQDKRAKLAAGATACAAAIQQLCTDLAAAQGSTAPQHAAVMAKAQDVLSVLQMHERRRQHQSDFERRRQRQLEEAARRERLFGHSQASRGGQGEQSLSLGLLEGPGELRQAGPRHSNDHADIRRISVMPTSDEVLCSVTPYLPKGGPVHLPPGSTEAHLDRQFRLLRHDILVELCSGVAAYQAAAARRSGSTGSASTGAGSSSAGGQLQGRRLLPAAAGSAAVPDVRVFDYKDVVVEDVRLTKYAGAHFILSFADLDSNKRKSPEQRRDFWTKTKRLQHGTLVCLVLPPPSADREEQLVFATICQRDLDKLAPRKADPGFRPSIGISLGSGQSHAEDLRQVMRLLLASRPHQHRQGQGGAGTAAATAAATTVAATPVSGVVLLQSSGSFFAYEPILKALQRMEHLPLQQHLVPAADAGTVVPGRPAEVAPPAYLAASRHVFDLSVLADASRAAELDPTQAGALRRQLEAVNLLDPAAFPTAALAALTTLDEGQVASLKASLVQQLSLIQGPPGTGKSYIGVQLMRVLQHNLGPDELPILIVCYTNHALDQILEDLKRAGLIQEPREMVRIGSRSKSEAVMAHNLRQITQGSVQKQSERGLAAACYESISLYEQDCKDRVERLELIRDRLPWHAMEDLVQATAHGLYCSLVEGCSAEEGGWHRSNASRAAAWGRWLHGSDLHRRRQWQRQLPGQQQHRQEQQVPGQQDQQRARQLEALRRRGFGLLAELEDEEGAELAGGEAGGADGAPMSESETEDAADAEMEWEEEMEGAASNAAGPAAAAAAGSGAKRSIDALLSAEDAWALSMPERQRLAAYWQIMLQDDLLSSLQRKMELHAGCLDRLRRIHECSNLEVLRGAKVIGATTSGVAMHQELIAALGIKIVMVEEAAEVLEPHVLASLTQHTEQVILIGDHEQLRPKVQAYPLSMDSGQGYNLDLSLFERLVRQGRVPVNTLSEQHRMRPEFSALIRATIYPDLKDHPKVHGYGAVKGMQHHLYWMTHTAPEGGDRDDLGSKYNAFEAQMATRLARYLVQNGYGTGSITILTPYVGQLLQLRREASRHFCISMDERDAAELVDMEDAEAAELAAGGREVSMRDAVRLATIDNYQGEENRIIILSLVRSNRDNQIGFVQLQNRTNVLLSRARQGMYIIGNADCLVNSRHPGIWPQVVQMFEQDGIIGPAFHLVCQKHPDYATTVSTPADFDARVSDGGCARNCTGRLQPCGHACPRRCHSDDPNHRLTKCMRPCNRPQPCGHLCQRKCHEKCGRCEVRLDVVELPCGHTMRFLECWRAQQLDSVRCEQTVEVIMPHCGHVIRVACADVHKAQRMPWMCSHGCEALLSCEHPCSSTCGRCLQGWLCQELGLGAPALPNLDARQKGSTLTVQLPGGSRELQLPPPDRCRHAGCRLQCDRTLFCGHSCHAQCHQGQSCRPCRERCAVKCTHSACHKKCGEYCPPCAEPCSWECRHQGACPMPCGAPCVRLPCDRRCDRVLACGCRCPSVCGEPCPPTIFCPNHGRPDVTVMDPIMCWDRSVLELSQHELDEDPLICLPCRHAFPMSAMDMHLELEACQRSNQNDDDKDTERRGAYTKHPDGSWAAPFPLQDSFSAGKTCMKCRAPLGQIMRYGRLLNKHGIDAAERKFLQQADLQLGAADSQLAALSQRATAATGADLQRGPASMAALRRLQEEGEKVLPSYRELVRMAAAPPTVQVYDTARATVLRLAAERELPQQEAEGLLHQLVAPRPDVSIAVRILLGRTQCCMELLQLGGAELSLCVDELLRLGKRPLQSAAGAGGAGSSRGVMGRGSVTRQEPTVRAAQLVSRIVALNGKLGRHFSSGQAGAQQAVQLAGERDAPRLQISALRSHAQLLMCQAMCLAELDSGTAAEALGQSPEAHRAATRREMDSVLDAADEALAGALQHVGQLARAARGDLESELATLQRRAKRLRSMGELTEEEKDEVVRALTAADPSLANAGYTGSGHFNRCACGYVYVIADCGGADQIARCPSCGRTIGGTGHRLAAGNAPAADFFQRVQHR